MDRRGVFVQVPFGCPWETRCDSLARQIAGRLDVAMQGHAYSQFASTHPEFHSDIDLCTGLLDQIASGDSQIDRSFGAQRWNIVGSEEGDVGSKPTDPRK
jgi:hypothetical protein